jgi:hypothetical protein
MCLRRLWQKGGGVGAFGSFFEIRWRRANWGVSRQQQAMFLTLGVKVQHHRQRLRLAYRLQPPSHQHLTLVQHCVKVQAIKRDELRHRLREAYPIVAGTLWHGGCKRWILL